MASFEGPVLILVVFEYDLVLERSIDNCKLGLYVISAGRHKRHVSFGRRHMLLDTAPCAKISECACSCHC